MSGMRKRNINSVIASKMNKWLASLPEEFREDAKRDVVVTGGCVASMLLGEEVNDYDLYFKTKDTVRKLADHYLADFLKARIHKNGGIQYEMTIQELKDSRGKDRIRCFIKSAGVASEEQQTDYRYFEGVPDEEKAGEYVADAMTVVDDEEKPRYRPVFLSSNAITLSDDVQIILRFFGQPADIHENFDFVHCMNYWTFAEGVVLRQDALEALMSKALIYNGSLYPICSVFRAKKFILRGWQINAGQYLKMCLQISKLDLTSFQILEEQLTGVDAAYFSDLLNRARDSDNPEKVDSNYLVEIINRMF